MLSNVRFLAKIDYGNARYNVRSTRKYIVNMLNKVAIARYKLTMLQFPKL